MKVYKIINKLVYPEAIQEIKTDANKLYFTFDDGPDPQVTPHILSLLDQFNAKATFFCLGDKVEKFPYLFQEIQKRGHAVGNHGFSHIDAFQCTHDEFMRNVEQGYKIIQSKLFRPPYGHMRPINYQWVKRRYKIILWDIMSDDYSSEVTADEVIHKVTTHCKEGSIIVFHDTIQAKDRLFEALPYLLSYFKKFKLDKIEL